MEMNARQSARPWLAHTRHRFAAMLLARGRPEDKPRATALLRQACNEATALGMRGLSANATALLAEADGVDDKETYPASIKRNEIEVLRLIAAGKSNREIADRLFLSSNTIANHVRNILAKTNTANRTEAAAFALRASLVDP